MSAHQEWQAPGDDWLALDRAPFFFSPGYVAPGEGHRRTMMNLLNRIVGDHGSVSADGDARFAISIMNARLQIDTDDVRFLIEDATGRRAVTQDFDDPIGAPDEFLEQMRMVKPKDEFAAALKALAGVAEGVWQTLQHRFELAITHGDAQLVGRWNDIAAPFSRIFPDQWEHLRDGLEYGNIIERAAPRLRARGTLIFSPMVRPIPRPPTAKVESECLDWLIDVMAGPWRKVEYDEAKERYPDLSQNAFERALKKARPSAKNKAWAQRGRKSELNSPP